MRSTPHQTSGYPPLWWEVRASIVPALIQSNLNSKWIGGGRPQRCECSPWIGNFSEFDGTVGGSSTEFFYCVGLTESSFHQFAPHFGRVCKSLSRNRGSFVQQLGYCLRNIRRRTKSLEEVSRVYLVAVVLRNPRFHGFCNICAIDCRNFIANTLLMLSFEALIKFDGYLPNVLLESLMDICAMPIFRMTDIQSMPKCRICRAGVSQYLLISIKVHKTFQHRYSISLSGWRLTNGNTLRVSVDHALSPPSKESSRRNRTKGCPGESIKTWKHQSMSSAWLTATPEAE
jgi:hypothetical protein